MEPGAPGASAQSNIPVIHLQQSASQSQLDDKDEWQQQEEQQKQQFMHGGHQHQWDDHSESSAESNSPVLHLQQFTSQLQGDNQRNQLKDNNNEQQQQGEQKQQLMKGELQQQQNQQGNHSNQHELFQQSQPQHPEQGQPHVDDQSEHLWLETLQVQQEQHKEEQEQHQHQDKQLHMQQALQTHQQLQQLQIQPQVQQLQQQQFNHRQSLWAVTSEQNTSRSITFSYLVEMILPHLPREQAEWARATLLRFKRKEITRNDFVSSTRKVVGDRILVQTVKQIQKKAPLATSSTATLHHTLSAFGGPISGGHTSGNLLQGQMCIQMASAPPSSAVGSQMNTPPKIALFGQKECYEATIPSKQLPRKKQKVSGDYLDQRIDQLNDVTAVSGVNLREEEEKLFAGPKDESCVAEAIRNVVQEEERFFLEKGPLHAKLAAIMAKYSIKYISTDSERCLSLCVEEHLRTMIGQLIRLSKQRVDLERVGHKVALTSDVRCQILALNKKVKEDLEKKQAEEAEKLRKLYGTSTTENNASTEAEKDESNVKIKRAHKESDKMRANAANVAARAAIGGDDMLLKWQRMAEQAQQKHKGTLYQTSNTCTNRDVSRKNMAGRLEAGNVSDHLDAPSTGIVQNLGREYPSSECTQTEAVHAICVKDVIALLEQEPHMTKSTLLYLLYERHAE